MLLHSANRSELAILFPLEAIVISEIRGAIGSSVHRIIGPLKARQLSVVSCPLRAIRENREPGAPDHGPGLFFNGPLIL